MPIIPTRAAAQVLALVTGILLLDGQRHLASPPATILGWWHGTSTCVHAPWNSGCNDEVVEYQFVAMPADSGHALLHAFKVVGDDYELMGDLPLVYAADSQAWNGDFANGRVDIRWSYRVLGDTLRGLLVERPALRVARHTVAWRGKDDRRHSAPHN